LNTIQANVKNGAIHRNNHPGDAVWSDRRKVELPKLGTVRFGYR
jgi:hypothetical protein